MSTYYVSETGHDMHDSATAWFPLRAHTERGAMREISREHSGGYRDHVLHVGVDTGRRDTFGNRAIISLRRRVAGNWEAGR